MPKLKTISLFLSFLTIAQFISCSSSSEDPTVFEIKFENISSSPSFTAANGSSVITAFSSMFAVIHESSKLLYTQNTTDLDQGLSDLAQNGDPSIIAQAIQLNPNVEIIGIANEPSNGSAGILAPGQSFSLILSTTSATSRLSIASSFIQGNDILAMTKDDGIPLFTNGVPLSGNVTSFFDFYDVGTERNEAPGIGPNQVVRQGVAPADQTSAGTPESKAVRKIDDGFNYPSINQSIRVTISLIAAGTTVASPTPSVTASARPSASPSTTASASPSPSVTVSASPSSSNTTTGTPEVSSSPST